MAKSSKLVKKETMVKARADQNDDLQKLNTRINRIVGQLGGIKRMLETNRSHMEVLTQLNSVQASVRSIQYMILQQYVEQVYIDDLQKRNGKATEKLMDFVKYVRDY